MVDGPHSGHLTVDRAFGLWVSRLVLPPHNVFFGFSYASLEALQAEKERGVFTVLEQFDLAEVHDQLVRRETLKWPDYASVPPPAPQAYFERVRQEWATADIVVVNSEWTREALVQQGVPDHKIELNPLGFVVPKSATAIKHLKESPCLKVLWVGTVSIAKGIPYLVEAARALKGKPVEFTVAGPLAIKPQVIESAPSNIRWLGQVPRVDVAALYQSHHVFVLPTISDGFAITQLEALAYGLPVIITPNCARIVEDGETGFVIPPYSSEALVQAILRFVEDPALLGRMSSRCAEVAGQYSVDAYASRLANIIKSRMGITL
ncbi:MAG: glycosyltransferase family 4 protein [Anaerolineae bacterium]